MTEPVKVVRRYFAAFGAGDVDAAMAYVVEYAVWQVAGAGCR